MHYGKKMMTKEKSTLQKKRKFSKWWIFLAVLILIFGSLAAFIFIPTPAEEEIVLNPINSDIYSALVAIGIKDAFVDMTQERVIVSYDLPANIQKEASWYYVMGVVASTSSNSGKVIIQAYVNSKATEEVTVQMIDIQEFLNEQLTDAEFTSKLKISSI